VNHRLKQKMIAETEEIWRISQELAISMRTAAYVHGLNRLGEAMNAKGTRDFYVKN
jgi:glutamate dehydrogenase (NADP+)